MLSVRTLDNAIYYLLFIYAGVSGISRVGVYISIILLSLIAVIRYIREPFSLNIDSHISQGMKVLLGVLIVSTIMSSNFLISIEFLSRSLALILPFFVAATFIKENRTIDKLVLIMSISILCGSAVAIFQGLHGNYRASSFLGIMNFAGAIGLILPMLIVYIFEHKNIEKSKRYLLMVAAFVSIIALLFNGTRSIWISTIICLVTYLLISGRFQKKKVIITIATAIILIFAVLLMNNSFIKRVESIANTTTDTSNIKRINMWYFAIDVFKEHPLLGTGLATLPSHTGTFISREDSLPVWDKAKGDHVHNIFLQVLAENGVIGLSGFLFFWHKVLLSIWQRMNYPDSKMWSYVALLCTLNFLIHGMFDYIIALKTVMYAYSFILGLAYANFNNSKILN